MAYRVEWEIQGKNYLHGHTDYSSYREALNAAQKMSNEAPAFRFFYEIIRVDEEEQSE